MDVVSHAGAIRCGIVVSEYTHFLQLAHSHLCHIRQQIVRDPLRVLTDQPGFMGTDGIEIPQQYHIPFRIRCVQIRQNLLEHPLAPAIGIRADTLRAVLRDGDLCRVAIDRGA